MADVGPFSYSETSEPEVAAALWLGDQPADAWMHVARAMDGSYLRNLGDWLVGQPKLDQAVATVLFWQHANWLAVGPYFDQSQWDDAEHDVPQVLGICRRLHKRLSEDDFASSELELTEGQIDFLAARFDSNRERAMARGWLPEDAPFDLPEVFRAPILGRPVAPLTEDPTSTDPNVRATIRDDPIITVESAGQLATEWDARTVGKRPAPPPKPARDIYSEVTFYASTGDRIRALLREQGEVFLWLGVAGGAGLLAVWGFKLLIQ